MDLLGTCLLNYYYYTPGSKTKKRPTFVNNVNDLKTTGSNKIYYFQNLNEFTSI